MRLPVAPHSLLEISALAAEAGADETHSIDFASRNLFRDLHDVSTQEILCRRIFIVVLYAFDWRSQAAR